MLLLQGKDRPNHFSFLKKTNRNGHSTKLKTLEFLPLMHCHLPSPPLLILLSPPLEPFFDLATPQKGEDPHFFAHHKYRPKEDYIHSLKELLERYPARWKYVWLISDSRVALSEIVTAITSEVVANFLEALGPSIALKHQLRAHCIHRPAL